MILRKTLLITVIALSSMQLQANELISYLKNLYSFQADFTQSVFAPNNQSKQKSKGVILVQSPNKFYLEYNNPYNLIYVADGRKLWSYDEDLEQVVVKPQGDLLVNSPAMLLGNPKDLTRSYRIEKTGIIEGLLWYELTPKKDNGNFETVGLAFDDNKLVAMEMRDNFGQTTRLDFINVVKNPELAQSRFKFIPPKGVDIIGQ